MLEMSRLGVDIEFQLIEMLAAAMYLIDPDAEPEATARAEFRRWM
jgi:hypothetical protein